MKRLNAFFASVYIGQTCSKLLHVTTAFGKQNRQQWGKKKVRDYLVKLNVFTAPRLGDIHPSALKELSNVIVRLLPVIYKKSHGVWLLPSRQVSPSIIHILRKGKRSMWRAIEVSLTLGPRKFMEHVLWELISGYMKRKKTGTQGLQATGQGSMKAGVQIIHLHQQQGPIG